MAKCLPFIDSDWIDNDAQHRYVAGRDVLKTVTESPVTVDSGLWGIVRRLSSCTIRMRDEMPRQNAICRSAKTSSTSKNIAITRRIRPCTAELSLSSRFLSLGLVLFSTTAPLQPKIKNTQIQLTLQVTSMFACRLMLPEAAKISPHYLWRQNVSSVTRWQEWTRKGTSSYPYILRAITSRKGPTTRRFLSSGRSSPPSLRREFGRQNTYKNNPYEQRGGQNGIPHYLWIGGFGIPLAGLTYLYVHYLDRVPLTQRQRWIATSPEWERQLGDEEYRKLLLHFRGKILPPDHRASVTVQRVGSRIYQAAQAFCQEHHVHNQNANSKTSTISSPPTFTVVHSEMANAFVLPNNHIFVMTGLFKYARNEEELASVLGHEMAHNLARHMGEKLSGNLIVQLLARLSLLADPTGTLMMIFLPTANLLRELPHSRTQELEADHIGMLLAAQACYDPAAAKRVFQRMKQDSTDSSSSSNGQGGIGSSPPEFLSTHPSHDSRLVRMDDWLPEARRILERDGGETCRRMQRDIERARQIAAQRAAERELALRQLALRERYDPFH